MIFFPFAASLARPLGRDDMDLPLAPGDLARLADLLPDGERTLLAIRDDIYVEEAEIVNECGTPRISARGLHGTEPRKFPRGSCLGFEVTLAAVKWLVCNHECCPDGPCPGEPAQSSGLFLPEAEAGRLWQGTAIFSGSLPMVIVTSGLPSWAEAEAGPNWMRMWGEPPGPGEWQVAITAANLSGTALSTQQGELRAVQAPQP